MFASVIAYFRHGDTVLFSILIVIVIVLIIRLVRALGVIRRLSSSGGQSISHELEYQQLLRETTECLYENIFEFDITNDRGYGAETLNYFRSLGIDPDTPYEEALKVIAAKQIKEEYIQSYLETFSSKNVLEVYGKGIRSLSRDVQMTAGDGEWRWIRISARIFFWDSDKSVRMISYRTNIDAEKKREFMLLDRAQKDSLTDLYNKRSSEEMIQRMLQESVPAQSRHALLMIDIDNFKNINDNLGHAFGDYVLTEFTSDLKKLIRDTDVAGRSGGDEFIVLLRNFGTAETLREKLENLCAGLARSFYGNERPYPISVSIGVALYPEHGTVYSELAEKADEALYYSKGHGKNTFTVYGSMMTGTSAFHVNQRDIDALINAASDGISKVACADKFKLLYYNRRRAELTGTPLSALADPDYDVLGQIHPDDVGPALDIFRQAIPTKSSFSVYLRLRHEDGHYLPVRLRGLFVHELFENKYPIFYAVYTDLSDIITSDGKIGVQGSVS